MLLAFFFISPKAVDSKTTVAISSASHHAHDGRVTQHLKSHKEMTESIDGDKEDRVSLIDFTQLAKDNELPDETDRKKCARVAIARSSRFQLSTGTQTTDCRRRYSDSVYLLVLTHLVYPSVGRDALSRWTLGRHRSR